MASLTAPPKFPGAASPFPPEKGFPNWPSLVAASSPYWKGAVAKANGPKVLVCTNTGMHGAVSTFDTVLSVALTLAGARASRVFCDGVMPSCLMPTFGDATPPDLIADRGLVTKLCKACLNRGTNASRTVDLPEHRLSQFLKPEDYKEAEAVAARVPVAEIRAWTLDGIAVGEHAYAGALRYFATGDLVGQPRAKDVLRRYLEGAILAARAYDRLIEKERPDVAVLHHGIYSPQGVAADVCRKRGVRVVTWVVAYRQNCFILSHDDTYHHTLMTESVEQWEGLSLSEAQESVVHSYLASRASGGRDWIYFHKDAGQDFEALAAAKGIDRSKPVVSAFTNVVWDAQLHYPANVFPGMIEWLIETIRHFAARPEIEFVVRVHPAETRGAIKSRQLATDEIAKAFPNLPRNIHIIGPEEEANSYALAKASNAVIIYGTKMGTELAPLGIPVVVAGEAWIKNKGVTKDPASREDYFALLNQMPIPEGAWAPDMRRAAKYAYHFFFRRMLPLPFLEPNGTGAMFDLKVGHMNELAPGRWPGLDAMVNGIIGGAPFVYRAEEHGVHDDA